MDFIMLAALAGGTGAIVLLIGWCRRQVDRNE